MPVRKEAAPNNDQGQPVDSALTDQTTPTSTAPVDASGDVDVVSSPDGVGLSAKEMQKVADQGYHDSISGRPVDSEGNFVDGVEGEGPIEAHRVVANDWPARQGSGSRAMTADEARHDNR